LNQLTDDNPNPQRVLPEEVLKTGLGEGVGTGPEGKVLAPLQRVGFWLAIMVFGYIVLASLAIFLVSFRGTPVVPLPSPPTGLSTESVAQYKTLVESYHQSVDAYQQLQKISLDRALGLFQLVIASTILPAFTAILGYIFGSRRAD
jgi:hypothetical protein